MAFKVPQSASKLDIKGAVERIFDVQVQQVRTINVMGKLKRTVAGAGRQSKYKKAYVTLAEGHTVDVISGV